ncbi:Gfo/Idh/MocA family protein [Mycobacterium marinum]|uniref:Gfo/Idh/MocA family protein n=2 Tax=Mycobacterium marinum TaxID=1781 RepID=UPI0009DB795E|nr:Gfo/Idh/MocA family oxidoreductase [Mycobacterium marinum]
MSRSAPPLAPQRVLFCGAGRWGKKLIRAFLDHGAVPAGFVVRTNSTMQFLAAEYPNVPIGANAEQLIGETPADVLVVATPTPTHSRLALMGLHQGRDVFVEKPLCTDSVDARALADAARATNAALFTGFVYLHHPAFAALRSALAIENIAHLDFHWNRPALGGRPEWELLPHELAIASVLLGELPPEVSIHVGDGLCRCRWTSTSGVPIDIRLDGRTGIVKRKELVVRTTTGQVWKWTDHELVHHDQMSSERALQRATFGAAEPLRREVDWFFAHRRESDAMRHEIDRSVAITTLISEALAAAAPVRSRLH